MPSGFTSLTAMPSVPINHSRPIVGVAKRVRTMLGIPTINASAIMAIPETSVIHDMRMLLPSIGSYNANDATTNMTRPTPVQKRGTPTCTSTANASTASTMSATAHPRTGKEANPYVPSKAQIAPTTPAIPIPAVKNSNTNNASPMANNKYATGGLATVCIN